MAKMLKYQHQWHECINIEHEKYNFGEELTFMSVLCSSCLLFTGISCTFKFLLYLEIIKYVCEGCIQAAKDKEHIRLIDFQEMNQP